jgi:hypothetical protein
MRGGQAGQGHLDIKVSKFQVSKFLMKGAGEIANKQGKGKGPLNQRATLKL